MTDAAEFHLLDQEISSEPFHYTMCGLDDIYLRNGVHIESNKYGSGVVIDCADDLHKVIGVHLIVHRKFLRPKDVRFLRKNMGVTQEELAYNLGITSQSVARYEKAITEIPGPVDRLLRFVYILHLIPEDQRRDFIEQVSAVMKENQKIDEYRDDPVYFNKTVGEGWKTTARQIGPAICAPTSG